MKFVAALIALILVFSPCVQASTPSRVVLIRFNTEVNDESAEQMEAAFKVVADTKPDAVLMVINSPGGSLPAGWRIIQAIRSSPVPVHCIVDGEADSMAFVMLQACTTRGITAESKLLAHQPYVRIGNEPTHINDLKTILNFLVAMSEQIDVMCSTRMRMPLADYQTQTNGIDWWMSSVGALKAHAVDYVTASVDSALKKLN